MLRKLLSITLCLSLFSSEAAFAAPSLSAHPIYSTAVEYRFDQEALSPLTVFVRTAAFGRTVVLAVMMTLALNVMPYLHAQQPLTAETQDAPAQVQDAPAQAQAAPLDERIAKANGKRIASYEEAVALAPFMEALENWMAGDSPSRRDVRPNTPLGTFLSNLKVRIKKDLEIFVDFQRGTHVLFFYRAEDRQFDGNPSAGYGIYSVAGKPDEIIIETGLAVYHVFRKTDRNGKIYIEFKVLLPKNGLLWPFAALMAMGIAVLPLVAGVSIGQIQATRPPASREEELQYLSHGGRDIAPSRLIKILGIGPAQWDHIVTQQEKLDGFYYLPSSKGVVVSRITPEDLGIAPERVIDAQDTQAEKLLVTARRHPRVKHRVIISPNQNIVDIGMRLALENGIPLKQHDTYSILLPIARRLAISNNAALLNDDTIQRMVRIIVQDMRTYINGGLTPDMIADVLPYMTPQQFLEWGRKDGPRQERVNRAVQEWEKLYGTIEDGARSPSRRTSDILDPLVRPQRWGRVTQFFWYIFVSVWEEGAFRYLALGTLPVWLGLHGVDPITSIAAGLFVSVVAFFLFHPLFRWMARARQLEIGLAEWRIRLKGITREIAREWDLAHYDRLRSPLWSGLALSLIFVVVGYGLTGSFTIAAGITAIFHLPYDWFIANPISLDPLFIYKDRQEMIRDDLRKLDPSQFDRYWIVQADGDQFGNLNAAAGKSVIGYNEYPSSPDIVFYKQSLFREGRETVKQGFNSRQSDGKRWSIYAGAGGDELATELVGSHQDIQTGLSSIVQDYNNHFRGHWAFFSISTNYKSLSADQIRALENLSGTAVLQQYGDGYTLSVNLDQYAGPYSRLKSDIEVCLNDHAVHVEEIILENDTRGPLTLSFGAISLGQVLQKLTQDPKERDHWIDPKTEKIREDRIDHLYSIGKRLAEEVLYLAKEGPEGRNRAIVADDSIMTKLNSIPAERRVHVRQSADSSGEQPSYKDYAQREIQRLSYANLRRRFSHRPSRYIYHFTVSNWIGSGTNGHRELHALNALAGYERVNEVIKALDQTIPLAFPAGSQLVMGRSPPDSFTVASDVELQMTPAFWEAFKDTLASQLAVHTGGTLSSEDRALLKTLNPHLIIYRADWDDLKAARRIEHRRKSAQQFLDPMQTIDIMSSVEWLYEMMPASLAGPSTGDEIVRKTIHLESLRSALHVDSHVEEGYHILSLDPRSEPLLALHQKFREAQQAKAVVARRNLAAYYGTRSAPPAGPRTPVTALTAEHAPTAGQPHGVSRFFARFTGIFHSIFIAVVLISGLDSSLRSRHQLRQAV